MGDLGEKPMKMSEGFMKAGSAMMAFGQVVNQVKGIITRAGKGTKIILLGDQKQIDKPFLDEKTNGLSYTAKYMKGSPYCWQITLSADECERSELAMDAVKRL